MDIKHSIISNVTEDDLATAWTDEYGVKYSQDGKKLLFAPNNLKEYTIKEGTIVVCDEVFSEGLKYNVLESITFPDSLKVIGNEAFRDCCKLSLEILPKHIVSIGTKAFSGCESIVKLAIPNTVNHIGDDAFYECKALENVNIPKSITEIGKCMFQGCAIDNIEIPDNVTKIGFCAFANCESLKSIIVPDSVTSIGDYAFSGCRSLENVSIPNSLKEIGAEVFRGCAITTLIIPNSIRKIGDRAFWDCNLSSITIPDSVKTIEEGAFYGCPLLSITLPNSITKIEDEVFNDCFALKQINIPNSVTEIGNLAFYSCAFTEIKLPNSIVRIGNHSFNFCESLKQMNIPDSVEIIEDGAFANCYSLESVSLPNSIKYLGDSLFHECDELRHIIIPIGTKDKFDKLLPDYKDKLVEQEDGWTVMKTRCFDDEEIAIVARAEVVPSLNGKSVCFFMMTGGRTYIPLVDSSKLTVGETLDLAKAVVVTLRKGNREITRVSEICSPDHNEELNVEEKYLNSNKKDNNQIRFLDPRQYELSNIKAEADLIARYLNNNFQEYLYHFTHKNNLKQIKEMGGLYSWVQLENMGKPCPYPGGDSLSRKLDCKNGVADYVHLSFSYKHPMSYRNEDDIVILFIHPIVCLLPDTLFCDMNATDRNHKIGPNYKDLVNINLWTAKMNYLNSGTREFKEKQAEVLVKSHIPLEYIVNINLVS